MKPSKYRNKKTVVDGITFDSKKEAKRYGELKLMEKAGVIDKLILQKRFDLDVNGHRIAFYKADFMYYDYEKESTITEDCKGFKTPVYNLKKKLMKAIYGIDIYET